MDSYNEIAKETSVGDLYSSKISLDTVGSIDDNEFEKIYNETKKFRIQRFNSGKSHYK